MALTVFDAGIVIASFESENVHHERAAAAVGATIERGDAMFLPASAYAELMVRPAAGGDSLLARADGAIDELGIIVVPADRDIARQAAQLRAKHRSLRLPDALVIATAITLDAEHLLTTDRAWKRLRNLGVRGLTVVG